MANPGCYFGGITLQTGRSGFGYWEMTRTSIFGGIILSIIMSETKPQSPFLPSDSWLLRLIGFIEETGIALIPGVDLYEIVK